MNAPEFDMQRQHLLNEAIESLKIPEPLSSFSDLGQRYDLNNAECASLVKRIAQLIYSDDDALRIDVVEALCCYRPVQGYAWVAAEGFSRSAGADIHYFGTGLLAAYGCKREIPPWLLASVAGRLLEAAPQPAAFYDAYDFKLAARDHAYLVNESWRVLQGLVDIQNGREPAARPMAEKVEADVTVAVIDWRRVAEILLSVARSQPDSSRELNATDAADAGAPG
ncbi:MAG TPA: hypothetical protein P5572_12700 [Phycisphaerae bacterium]|nr:hypothetical protein [Phycisphaerae bacterium]